MQTYNFHHLAPKTNLHRLLLQCFFVFVFLPGLIHAADMGDPIRYHENGELTAIEDTNILVINGTSYPVHQSVHVVNAAGKPTSLNMLSLPIKVNFEYSYIRVARKTMAKVIVYIEDVTKNGRSM